MSGDPSAELSLDERSLTALATRRPVGVTMVVLSVVLFGVISFRQLPRNLMPDISYPTITVRTEYAGAAPIDVEKRVSRRLEEALAQVKSLRRISSVSRAEASDIVLEFAWNTDMGVATTDVREKVAQAVLPDEAGRPSILRYDPTLDPILQIAVVRSDATRTDGGDVNEDQALVDLRVLAEDLVERELETVSGVAGVRVRGGLEREIRLEVDESLLRAKGVSIDLINRRIAEENLNLASGFVYEGDNARLVRTVNELESVDEIRDIILRRDGTVPLRIRDVARVDLAWAEPEVITRINGRPCVKVDVFKEADANLVEVAGRVRERIFGTEAERAQLARYERERASEVAAPSTGSTGSTASDGSTRPDAQGSGSGSESSGSAGSGSAGSAAEGSAAEGSAAEGSAAEGSGSAGSGSAGSGSAGSGSAGSGSAGSDSAGSAKSQVPPATKPRYLLTRLPEDVEIRWMSDQSVFIESSLNEVRSTVFIGGLLAILVLYIFLRNGWFTLAVGLSIPLSVVATFIAMHLFGVSLNMMSLGGLALGIGMLVDNSIVVLESIFRCREEGDSPRRAAVRGTRAVASAVTASTLTTVAVFFPIVFVEGVAGQIFRDQALTVVISLLASLATALYFIPALVCRGAGGDVRATSRSWSAPRLLRARIRRWPLAETLRRVRARRWSPARLPWRIVQVLAWDLPGLIVATLVHTLSLIVLAITVAVAAVVAIVWAAASRVHGLLVSPLLAGLDRGFRALERAYRGVLSAALAHPGLVFLLVGALGIGAVRLFFSLETELIPEVHQGELTVEVRLPRSTRIEKTDGVLRPWEERLLKDPELDVIESLTTTIGVEKDDVQAGDDGEHSARFLLRLRREGSPEELEERVQRRVREIFQDAEIESLEFRRPVLFSFKTPIEVEVKSNDLDRLTSIVSSLLGRLDQVEEIEDLKSNLARGAPEVQLRLDRDALSRYGLTMSQVGQVVRRKLQGEVPSYFTISDRKVPIRARLEESDRDSLGELSDLVVNPGAEREFRLRDVLVQNGRAAGIAGEQILEIRDGPAEIRRISHERAAVVTANLAGMSLGAATAEVERALREVERSVRARDAELRRERPLADFTVGFGGQKEEMDLASSSLERALFLAIFLVFVVMAMQFESLLQPLIIIVAIPLALVGVIPILWLLELPLSIVVFIGLIVLAGIVVNNAIVLIDTANQLAAGRGLPMRDALLRAGEIRLRPILMTTLTTILGLLPLTGALGVIPGLESVLGAGDGAEIRMPLAVTVVAGLSVATLLTLVVIPVMASVVASVRGRLAATGVSSDGAGAPPRLDRDEAAR